MPPQNIENNTEYRELDLSKVDDLDAFFESVSEVCLEALEYSELAESEGFQSLTEDGVAGEEFFITLTQKRDELQGLIIESKDNILAGIEIKDEQIDDFQTLYNDIVLIRNHIRDTYGGSEVDDDTEEIAEDSMQPVQLEVTSSEQTEELVQEKEPEPEPETVSENTEDAVIDEEVSEVTEDVPSNIAINKENAWDDSNKDEEDVDDKETNEDIFTPVENELSRVKEKVYDLSEKARSVPSISGNRSAALAELKTFEKRVNDLKDRVESIKAIKEDEAVLKNNLNRYLRVAGEIQRDAERVLQDLIEDKDKDKETETESVDVSVVKEEKNIKAFEVRAKQDLNDEDTDNNEIERLTPEVKRKTMEIETETDNEVEKSIPISIRAKIAEDVTRRLSKDTKSEESMTGETLSSSDPKPVVVREGGDPTDVSVTATLESHDIINEAVPNKNKRIVHPKLDRKKNVFTREYLKVEPYSSFIIANYTSPEAFERTLDSVVNQIESETVDVFDRWLKEDIVSPFAFIKDMTVQEVKKLSSRPDVRETLSLKNIKYETFIRWIDMIDEMQSLVGDDPDMKFEELYARWIVEEQMMYVEDLQMV